MDTIEERKKWNKSTGRDYSKEKEYQSSPEKRKYRSELNKYNRKKNTYGNGDGKDASHKGGKIVGFESQSKNRGRKEKSRKKGYNSKKKNENLKLKMKVPKMKLQEVLREPWVVVDGNDGNKVIAQASNKQAAERIIGSSELPPLSVKDKSKLKVVKVKKKQNIGWPLTEADYKLYHNSFSSASQAAYDYAHKKGYTISDDEWFNSVSTGKSRGRPSVGQTNSFHVELEKNGKPQKKMLHFQVYGMPNNSYELNMYIN